jgi:hypothetical protein
VSAVKPVLRLHDDCGAEVLDAGGQLWTWVMLPRADGMLGLVEHLCRDYVAWRRLDRRDVWSMDVPGGWQPRLPAGVDLLKAA